jgi:hypothetical protein
LTERVVLNDRADQIHESVSELHTEAVLSGERLSGFVADVFIKRRLLVVRRVKVVDLRSECPIPPTGQEASSADYFDESEDFQYSGHALPPYANRCEIQWAIPVPKPISVPIAIGARTNKMSAPNVSPALFRGTVAAGFAIRSRAQKAGRRAFSVSRGSPDSWE